MNRLLKLSPIVLALALVSSTQLSCSVNDYCLNCEKGDGGGSGSNNDGGMDGQGDGGPDAGCVPTGGPEQCNGKDDDCNGLIDDNTEHEGEACPNVQGACAGGVLQCVDGANKQTETCNKQAKAEICDGIDNNCSGPIGTTNGVDEGDPGPPPAMGTAELTAQCGNGLDEDNDGVPDDGCPGAGSKCGTDQGECIAGQYHCDPATGYLKCQNFVDHRNDPEVCNGKDDDCDGVIDDNVPVGADCGPNTNVGACEFGKILCAGGQPTCGDPDPLDGIAMPVFPKFETCNNLDDDCNGQTDEIFNKQTDIKNCGNCGVICPTRMNANTTCTLGSCGFACKPGYKDLNGMAVDGCEFGPCFPTGTVEECDGQDNDCDNKTDEGLVPPALCLKGGECGGSYTDPNGSNPLGPAPTAQCSGMNGWTCTYPAGGFTQFPELRCDGKDNNCDGNIDENQPDKGQVCHEDRENPTTQCGADTVDNDGDGRVNDGCPKGGTGAAARAESLAECLNATDDDGDGLVNDGCPASAQRGVCQGTGTVQCDPLNLDGPAYCNITSPGLAKDPNESCDDKDNDCDGNTDEGGNLGNLVGQDWIDLGNGKQMMKYEASRPDSTASNQGQRNNLVCSKAGAQPWTNIKYLDALAACQSIGATLCTESQWHHACSVVASSPSTFTNANFGTATGGFIEAEDYSAIAAAGAAETACGTDTVDNDGDGRVNDGCPVVGTAGDTDCSEAVSDVDGDTAVNDGCPAVGPQAWVPDYTATTGNGTAPNNVSKFSGISAMEAVANLGGSIAAGSIATQAPRMDYTVNFPVTSANYRIWVKVFANNTADDKIYVSVDGANTIAVTAAAPGSCSATSGCPTGSICIDAVSPAGLDTCTPVWQWVNTNIVLGSVSAGDHTISVYMGDDGVKIDRLFVVNGATTASSAETSLTGAGFKWAYASSQNTYQPNTCNGHDYRQVSNSTGTRTNQGIVTITTATAHPFVAGDLVQIQGMQNASGTLDGTWTVLSAPTTTTFTFQMPSTSVISAASPATGGTSTEARDPTLPTASLTSCVANTGTGAFDMSGNVREWTLAHFSGENPIRGGASNGTADGISCPLSFTLADDTFFFPNIGFRCCRVGP